jgi:hypothetical protein
LKAWLDSHRRAADVGILGGRWGSEALLDRIAVKSGKRGRRGNKNGALSP